MTSNQDQFQQIKSPEWLSENEETLRKLFSQEWKEYTQADALRMGFQLKLMGIDWRSEMEFGKAMVILISTGVVMTRHQPDGALELKANPIWVPPLEIKR